MPNASPPVCVVGSSNIDLIFRTPRLPSPGETLLGQSFQMSFGGKGANQAVMAARLGARTSLVTKVGGDSFGTRYLEHLRDERIDTSFVLVEEKCTTGVAAIVVDNLGRNCIIVAPGANAGLSPEDVRAASSTIRAAQVLLCQLEVPIEASTEAFRLARSAGVLTILNPAPAALLSPEILNLTDFCVPNESELQLLMGRPVQSLDQVVVAAKEMLLLGPRAVIVTLGARGVMLVEHAHVEHVAPIPVEAKDTTGAGDAFIGSLAAFLGEQMSLGKALSRANAVAALSVTRIGAQSSFPSRAELGPQSDD